MTPGDYPVRVTHCRSGDYDWEHVFFRAARLVGYPIAFGSEVPTVKGRPLEGYLWVLADSEKTGRKLWELRRRILCYDTAELIWLVCRAPNRLLNLSPERTVPDAVYPPGIRKWILHSADRPDFDRVRERCFVFAYEDHRTSVESFIESGEYDKLLKAFKVADIECWRGIEPGAPKERVQEALRGYYLPSHPLRERYYARLKERGIDAIDPEAMVLVIAGLLREVLPQYPELAPGRSDVVTRDRL